MKEKQNKSNKKESIKEETSEGSKKTVMRREADKKLDKTKKWWSMEARVVIRDGRKSERASGQRRAKKAKVGTRRWVDMVQSKRKEGANRRNMKGG